MSLFLINRYEEFVDESNKEQENERLEKLKRKISERLKAKLSKDTEKLNVDLIETNNQDSVVIQEDKTESVEETGTNLDINVSQFKILGTNAFEKTLKVKRVLPYWLTNPTPISVDLRHENITIENIKFLDNSLKKKMVQDGLKYLFPVQAQVIPWLLQENKKSCSFWPRDLCVCAPTGSGKTLSYVLPIIQILSKRVSKQIRSLIILPVKELANQVSKVFKDYCIGTNLKVTLLTGDVSFTQEQQQIVSFSEEFGWQNQADIVICTAGRLVEHIKQTQGFSLKHLQFLVIDEADRIMDHIQNDWLYHLNRHLQLEVSMMTKNISMVHSKSLSSQNPPPQKLLFSATLSQDPEKLKEWNLFQPKLFSVVNPADGAINDLKKYTTPLELHETYTVCNAENKPLVLYDILSSESSKRTLCFTNSSQAAHRLKILLTHLLKDSMNVSELSAHGINKNTRKIELKNFVSGKTNILICTDALARGVDVTDCDLVISYDPPKNAKTYIHRVGRTGRAGRFGKAITILLHTQLKLFQDLLKTAGKQNIERFNVTQEVLQQYAPEYQTAIESLNQQLSDESRIHNIHVKSKKRGTAETREKTKRFKNRES